MPNRIKIIRATTVPMSLDAFCNGMLKELSQKYEVIGMASPGKELMAVAEREGVRTIAVPMERHISLKHDLISLCRMIKVFLKEKPTMVHSMTPKAGLLCMIAAWLCRVPVRVHTFTGLVFPTSTGLKRRVLMATDWLTCACATHIIPEGEGVKNDLLNNGITKKPIKVLGYGNVRGVDMEYYRVSEEIRAKSKELKKPESFTFLFVGRIVGDKGINELCEAFERLKETEKSIRLLLVGRFEDELDPVSDKTRETINNDSSIEAVGPKYGDELLAYYVAADCFVFPSYREGFPNTVLEAGAMGVPSIVTDINGSREIITEGENGIIIQSHDAEALFHAMLKMMRDKDAREKMADNARQMIASRYEQGFVRKCLYDFYDEIISRK
jgi:glycosyltransferase involved in cell wall biosynthesis